MEHNSWQNPIKYILLKKLLNALLNSIELVTVGTEITYLYIACWMFSILITYEV